MAGFADYTKRLKGLRKIVDDIGAPVAVRIEALVKEQFTKSEDAHGREYDPLAPATQLRHGSGTKPLSRWARHAKVRHLGRGKLVLVFDDKLARFHHDGTKNMPARPLLPNNALPESWNVAIGEEFFAKVREQMKGGA